MPVLTYDGEALIRMERVMSRIRAVQIVDVREVYWVLGG